VLEVECWHPPRSCRMTRDRRRVCTECGADLGPVDLERLDLEELADELEQR
jgi:hypothetical protein